MNIAIYVPSWPPGFAPNGIVTYASYLVPALRQLGHQVFVLTYQKTVEDSDPYTIDLQRFAPSAKLWHRAASWLAPESTPFELVTSNIIRALRDLLTKYNIDVLEMEESFGWSFAISRLNMLPVLVRLHGPWFLNGQFDDSNSGRAANIQRQQAEGRAIECADFVTAPAAEVLATVREHYGLKLAATRVISYPIVSAQESAIWEIHECNPNSILFVGRFDEHKGGDLVLRAFAELGNSQPGLTFVFVGPDNGVRSSDGKVLRYEQFVRTKLPVWFQSRTEFRGPLTHADVMSIRTKCFATIFASRYEVVGYTILEAMSLGCPLVATAVGGVPELIEDERNGLLVPSQDVTAMAAACRALLRDPSLAARLGRQAWEDCRTFHDPHILAKQTVDAYQEAVEVFRSRSKSWVAR
jgi:glycosyltransferase involved in cell wall biosynthesis